EGEFALPGREPVAIGIGEVGYPAPQLVLDPRPADRYLLARDLLALMGEVAVADAMRADCNQRIIGKGSQLVPGHAEVAANGRLVDAMPDAERGHFALLIMLGETAEPVVQPVERRLLG